VRQPRKRWVSHSGVAGCTAIAAVVTSGVSHRCCSVTKSRDRHEPCGSCWSCATAAKAVCQAQWSNRMYRFAAVVTSGVSHRFGSVTTSRDWHETCGSCWSCATAAKAVGQAQLSRRMYRCRCRRDLRRLPQVLQRDEISRPTRNLQGLSSLRNTPPNDAGNPQAASR
jgi:hypothetical protein